MAKILVMDDEPSIRELCSVVLGQAGHEVLEAGDGLVGIQVAQEAQPDLILLDRMMPLVDGLDALRTLKAHASTASIPVVMLTALDGISDVALATMEGADGYVTKPFEPDHLVDVVDRFTAVVSSEPTAR